MNNKHTTRDAFPVEMGQNKGAVTLLVSSKIYNGAIPEKSGSSRPLIPTTVSLKILCCQTHFHHIIKK